MGIVLYFSSIWKIAPEPDDPCSADFVSAEVLPIGQLTRTLLILAITHTPCFALYLKAEMGPKSQGKAGSNAKRKDPEPHVPTPDWPPLQPLVPSTDLTLETLLEEQIMVIRNLFTSTLCKKYVSFLSQLPLITTPALPKAGDALRVNDRLQLDDPALAEQLWSSTALKQLVNGSVEGEEPNKLTLGSAKKLWGGEVCGLNPRIRVYRYSTYLFTWLFKIDPRLTSYRLWTILRSTL